MRIAIKYRDGSDVVSEREISDVALTEGGMIDVFCHTRGEIRSFRPSRIERAWNPTSGEVFNIYEMLGLPTPTTKSSKPLHTTPPTAQEAKARRNKDKRELYKPFVYPIIAEHAKFQVFQLFGNRCFHCNSEHDLVVDHHIPQAQGGRLVPGNLSILCRPCNGLKLDQLPEFFYSAESLETIKALLAQQYEIFDFKFNWNRWHEARERYLIDLGISPEYIKEALYNENSQHYVGLSQEEHSVCISISVKP